ncbi:MAG: retron system putative HNH endonuclease [Thermoleophilia bacterium]
MGSDCHRLVAESLREEQMYLCCYCESEVAPDTSHVEHMAPRSREPARTYEYSNLAASCNGGTAEHCGRFKDSRHKNPGFFYDPTKFCAPHDPTTERLIGYLFDGSVEPASGLNSSDSEKATYMIGYIGLDCPRLTGRRRQQARAIVSVLGGNPDDDLVQWARNYYLNPDSEGRPRSFPSLSKALLEP